MFPKQILLLNLLFFQTSNSLIDVRGDTLRDCLPNIGKKFSRKIAAGKRISNTRLYLFIPENVSFSKTVTELTKFLSFHDNGVILYPDGSSLILERTISDAFAKDQVIENLRKERTKEREKLLSEAEKNWKRWYPSNFNINRLSIEDRVNRQLSEPSGGKNRQFHDLLYSLPKPIFRKIVSGGSVYLPYNSLPNNGKDILRSRGLSGSSHSQSGELVVSFDFTKDYAKSGIYFSCEKGSIVSTSITASILYPPIRLARDSSNLLYFPLPKDVVEKERNYKKRVRHNPDLDKLEFMNYYFSKPGSYNCGESLSLLSKLLGFSIIGDYDPCFHKNGTPFPDSLRGYVEKISLENKKITILEFLKIIEKEFDLEWDYKDKWFYFKSPRKILSELGEVDLSPENK